MVNRIVQSIRAYIRLSKARKWLRRPDAQDLFAAELVVPASFKWPLSFRVLDFPGLVACELIKGSGTDSRVITLWRDRPAFELRHADLLTRFGASLHWTGYVASVECAPKNFLDRAKDVLVRVAAAIGAITLIGATLSNLFEPPSVILAVRGVQPINVSRGGII